jgi:hypothetical protein
MVPAVVRFTLANVLSVSLQRLLVLLAGYEPAFSPRFDSMLKMLRRNAFCWQSLSLLRRNELNPDRNARILTSITNKSW